MTSNASVTSFLLVFVTSFALLHHAASETYNVLETLGWTVPDNGDAYPNWAANKKFKVGDTLVFNFETGQHDLAEVSKEEFDNCTSTNQTSIIRQGPANINLTSICPHYFICTIGKHCQFGQKLTINVTEDSATKTPSGFPPATATAPMPTTPGNSASHTTTGSFALFLLFISSFLLH